MAQRQKKLTRTRSGPARRGSCRAFTLMELLVVMVIIGIIITFLLVAAGDARRRAEEDATLALITKLEGGINDRLEALLQTRPDPNAAHQALAAIYTTTPPLSSPARAQVFAWYDYIKRELPDVFFVQPISPNVSYPLNFAAPAYPLGNNNDLDFMLPLGAGVSPPGEGIYGASYPAATGVYKNLGYLPAGYDGIDNNGNGLIDEWAEGVNNPPGYTTANPAVVSQVQSNLAAHQHHTARAETLYAMLVEGVGPLGSVFNRDDFSDREIKDTDGDGLPEFVDAWGQPLQFFRWPILYHTDSQKGQVIAYWDYTQTPPAAAASPTLNPPYLSVFEAREQDPLDPNQQLMAPAWWSSTNTPYFYNFPGSATLLPSPSSASYGVNAFEYFFHRLTEPLSGAGGAQYWDRGSTYSFRRAFNSRPLILSGGPDKQLGVFLFADGTPGTSPVTATQLLMVENNAMTFVNDFTSSSNYTVPALTAITPDSTYDTYNPNAPTNYGLQEAGKDDITNQTRQASGGGGGS
jgi:prepilin-type N-terminal cleavage/methylation domain-containing protein